MIDLPQNEQELMDLGLTESCLFKGIMGGVAGNFLLVDIVGFGLGGLFGFVLSSFDSNMVSPDAKLVEKSTKEQLKIMGKDMAKRSWSSAKNFGTVGGTFAASECFIESYRAKSDIYNSIVAGCTTGGILAAKTGPKGVIFGCVGFAAFSAVIDHFFKESGF